MRLIYLALLLIVTSLLLPSCNDEIFVDGQMPSETEIVLDGDDSSHSISFSTKGLQHITFDLTNEYLLTYYDKDGETIPPKSQVSDIARINYTTNLTMLDVTIDDGLMTFHCTEHSDSSPLSLSLRLDYEYISTFIILQILPGQPIEFVSLNYAINQGETTSYSKKSTIHCDNGSEHATTIEVQPFLWHQAYIIFVPDENWAKYLSASVCHPTFSNETWIISDKEKTIKFGTNECYTPFGIDRMLTTSVDIPPRSVVDVVCEVFYSSIKIPYHATFRNPVSKRQHISTGTCYVTEPTTYQIHLENAD